MGTMTMNGVTITRQAKGLWQARIDDLNDSEPVYFYGTRTECEAWVRRMGRSVPPSYDHTKGG